MSTVDPGEAFGPLLRLLGDLSAGIKPAERRRWSADIATELFRSNAKRERANIDPAGEAMPPRKRFAIGKTKKARKRVPKPERMFQKASTARFLKKRATADGASVGFVGSTARIMNVHQYGLRDTVSHEPDAKAVKYPKRAVLGISPEDRERILQRIAGRFGISRP